MDANIMEERKTRTTSTRIKLTLTDSTGQWTEEYPAPVEQEHQKWATKLVNDFNENRRQGELPRTLVSVEIVTSKGEVHTASGHDWQLVGTIPAKRISILTVVSSYKCNTCEITGKRKGTEWPPKPDKQFRGRFFSSCDIAREYLPLNPEERVVFRNRILGRERSDKAWHRRRGW